MDIRDIVRNATLQHKNTGASLDVLQVKDGQVQVDHWNPPRHEWLSVAQVLADYETPVQPDGLPVFGVEPLTGNQGEGIAKAVCIHVLEEHPAFVDDNLPVVLRATPAGVPVLEQYLAAVSVGDGWLDRECGGDGTDASAPLILRPGWSVALNRETYRKRYPSQWFSLLMGADHEDAEPPYLKVSVRDEPLARGLFLAIAAGDLLLAWD